MVADRWITQLFSFHPLNFDSRISHLQNALQHISYWMTANLLTLNSSKTEFLLIGLKNQLAKIHNSSFDTSHFAWNLGFIFDEHRTFSDQITALSKAYYYHIRQLRCIRQLPVPSLPLSFTPNLITVILSTINYLTLNYPVSSTSRTLLLLLSWRLPSPVISLPSYALFTGSGSLNASNTCSSHLPTKFSQLPSARSGTVWDGMPYRHFPGRV